LVCAAREGLTWKETARKLGIASQTVKNHRYEAMRRLDARSIPQALWRAVERGLIKIDRDGE